MPCNIEICRTLDLLVDFRKQIRFEINDFAALSADKVVMRFGFSLEPVEGTAGINFLCKALFDKNREISIDSAKA